MVSKLSSALIVMCCAASTMALHPTCKLVSDVQTKMYSTDMTEPKAPSCADTAVWMNPTHPEDSMIVGTLKSGGLATYRLNGELIQELPHSEAGMFDEVTVVHSETHANMSYVAVSDRVYDKIRFYMVDRHMHLRDVTAHEVPMVFNEHPEDLDMGHTASGLASANYGGTGMLFVSQGKMNKVRKLEVKELQDGRVTYDLMESISMPESHILEDGFEWTPCVEEDGTQPEIGGMVVDTELDMMLISQQPVGLFTTKLSEWGTLNLVQKTNFFGVEFVREQVADRKFTCNYSGLNHNATGNIVADAQGLALYKMEKGAGFYVLSSQGKDRWETYDRMDPSVYKGSWAISMGDDKVQMSEGLDVVSDYLGPEFPHGVMVVTDMAEDGHSNLKVVDAMEMLTAMGQCMAGKLVPPCGAPFGAEFGECESALEWMMTNWDKPVYHKMGVDGTMASIQRYLATKGKCPLCTSCPECLPPGALEALNRTAPVAADVAPVAADVAVGVPMSGMGGDFEAMFDNSEVLSENFKMFWKVDGDMIHLGVEGRTDGWVGLGFSQNGGMAPADIMIGWFAPNGTGIISDRWASDKSGSPKDASNDNTILASERANGYTRFAWSRLLVTGDAEDLDIVPGPMNIIWAAGVKDCRNGNCEYHMDMRGGKEVTMIQMGAVAPDISEDPVAAECMDIPGWVDSEGYGCEVYHSSEWCNMDGTLGKRWMSPDWGTFIDWGVDSVIATDACCACGGGNDMAEDDTAEPPAVEDPVPPMVPVDPPVGADQMVEFDAAMFENSQSLDDTYTLMWTVSGDEIHFGVEAKTPGWVGLGFSQSGGMAPSDIMIGWFSGDGTAIISDRWASDKSGAPKDAQEDFKLMAAERADGMTRFAFSRKLVTGDAQDMDIVAGPMQLIWACGQEDCRDGNCPYHMTARGGATVDLLGAGSASAQHRLLAQLTSSVKDKVSTIVALAASASVMAALVAAVVVAKSKKPEAFEVELVEVM